MISRPMATGNDASGASCPSLYDTKVLKEYVDRRRIDAMVATSEERRAFYLEEAEMCERRLRQSFLVPAIRPG
jgi:hypothetical protein